MTLTPFQAGLLIGSIVTIGGIIIAVSMRIIVSHWIAVRRFNRSRAKLLGVQGPFRGKR